MCHHVALQRIQDVLEAFINVFYLYKARYLVMSKKYNSFLCEDGIEKFVSQDHLLSSLSKPCDDKRWSSGQIFLSCTYTYNRFLYSFPSSTLMIDSYLLTLPHTNGRFFFRGSLPSMSSIGVLSSIVSFWGHTNLICHVLWWCCQSLGYSWVHSDGHLNSDRGLVFFII